MYEIIYTCVYRFLLRNKKKFWIVIYQYLYIKRSINFLLNQLQRLNIIKKNSLATFVLKIN